MDTRKKDVSRMMEQSAGASGAPLGSGPWLSISWLAVFFILHLLGIWLYTVYLRVQGAIVEFDQIQEFLLRPESLVGVSLAGWSLVLPALVLAGRSIEKSWWQGLGLVKFSLKHLWVWLLILLLYLGFEVAVLELLQVEHSEFVEQMVGQRKPLLVLTIVAWAPLVEELLFRGYLFGVWRQSRAGLWGTLLFTSSLFALMHGGQYGLVPLAFVFSFSVLMGIAREMSGSVFLPILLHGMANLVAVLAVNFLGLI
ncbi:CPBP family intramembrane glutamic endopeptidase [Microbulbifer mangrovi]|uniref:CPBP family intramembrane glutamic endopeptidase n=1 Tax=Microbulbifer mangrovi TaxID=927787 RepID=UPI001300D6E4|nr:CPBP family intramembrane glutamic endopeptidase [Microbulbifer mangrovi]